MPPRHPLAPAGAVGLAAVLWGLWWLPLRGLAGLGLTADTANAALYGAVTAVLAPWLWRRRVAIARGSWLLLGGGGLMGAALVVWNLALIEGEVVRVTLLFYLAPIWATLLGAALVGERIGPLRVASILLGLGGAWVLLAAAWSMPLPRSGGDWLGLAAGLLFALSLTLVRKGQAIDGRDQTLIAFATAGLLALAVLALRAPGPAATVPGLLGAAVVALAWLLPATWLILWGARHLAPGRVTLLMLLEVAVAAVSAALLTTEPSGLRELAGCLLILAAGALEGVAELRPGRPARSPIPTARPN